MRRIITIVLALTMILTVFAACGSTDSTTSGGSGNSGTTKNADSGGVVAADTSFVYVPDYMILPQEVKQMNQAKLIDGTVYFFADAVVGQRIQLVSDTPNFNWFAPQPSYNEDGSVPDGYHEEQIDVIEQQLFKVSPDGSGYGKVQGFTHPEIPATAMAGSQWTIGQMLDAGDNAVWITETGYFGYNDPDNPSQYIDDTRLLIRKVSLTDGRVLAELDSSAMTASAGGGGMFGGYGFTISYFQADAVGNLYIAGYDGTTYIYSGAGMLMGTVTVPQGSFMQNLIAMPDGGVAMMYGEFGGAAHTKPIDPNTRALGTEYAEINIGTGTGFGGGFGFGGTTGGFAGDLGDGKTLLYFDQTALYSVAPGEARKELVNWVDSDVDPSGIQVLGTLDETHVLCLSVTGGNNGMFGFGGFGGGATQPQSVDLISLIKTPSSQVPQKTVLTLAVNNLDYTLRAEVLRFNKRDKNYRIKIVDYSVYNTQADYSQGVTRLNTEIISGNIPDMILTSQLPAGNYAQKGLLEDLYPYLENDTALGGRAAIVPVYLKALETDSKLFWIGSGFSITTLSGDSRRVGTENGMDMDGLNAAIANNPQMESLFPYSFDRNTAVQMFLGVNLSEYVNKYTGECRFDSPDFAKLLEFVKKTFPESVDYSQSNYMDIYSGLLDGRNLLQISALTSFDSLMSVDALFNGGVAFVGFPCESKQGNVFSSSLELAMSSKCKDKEGAWSFMRGILTEEYQTNSTYGFPSNQKRFDQLAKDAMTENAEQGYYTDGGKDTDGDGKPDIWPKGNALGFSFGTTPIYYYAMTQAQYSKFMDYINSISRMTETDTTLTNIVMEELGPFFAGQKNATDTATVIQNRVKIYVNEQR